MNQNKVKIILAVLVVLLIAGVLYKKGLGRANNELSVVYLSTGEVYVGQLSLFPVMELKNGYILATAPDPVDPKKNNFQLNPLTEALWAPKHLYLNKKHIVFYGPILSNSKIAEALAAKKAE